MLFVWHIEVFVTSLPGRGAQSVGKVGLLNTAAYKI